jgi:hypothetical protein
MDRERPRNLALLVAVVSAGIACERGGRGGERGHTAPPVALEARAGAASLDAPLAAAPTPAREVVPQEEHAAAPALDPEEPLDPPTPERPGPGQALLRVRAVALETGEPLAGIELGLSPGEGVTDEEADEHPWFCSTQSDPSRGLENDTLLTNAQGRGEFLVEAGFAYALHGSGPDGRADEGELELGAFEAGTERDVRLALPTAWTLDWHGRIVDGESERALSGVEVVARGRDERVLARGVSRADGLVALRLPAWERMVVHAACAGFFPGGARVTRDETSLDAPQSVTLRRPAALVVRVRLHDGRPADGFEAEVRVPPWFVIEDTHREELRWSATTDAEGRCEFAELPSMADVFVDIRRGERTFEWTSMSETFQLRPGERRELEYELGGSLALEVRILDGAGEPLAGAALSLVESSQAFDSPWWEHFYLDRWLQGQGIGSSGGLVTTATTDALGRVSIDALRPGSYWLAPKAEDLPQVVWPFLIRPEDASRSLELRLDRSLFLTGTVVGPDGKPAREARLSVRTSEGWSPGLGSWAARDGSFTFGPLLAGSYRLQATRSEDPFFATSEEITVHAGGPSVSLAMTWGCRLRVLPTDAGGAELELDGARLYQNGRSVGWPDDGEFGSLAPGHYDLWVNADGCAAVLRGIAVRAQELAELRVPVLPGATLVLPSLEGQEVAHRLAVEWEGLDIGYGMRGEYLVPPGTVTARSFAWGDDFAEHVVDVQVHALAAGETWAVPLPK